MQVSGAVPIPEDVQRRYVADGLWDDAGLRDGIEHWALSTPERSAVVDNDGAWSYAELARAIALNVGALSTRGVTPGRAVLIVAPLSRAAVAAYQAVLRSGACVVMLDRRCGRSDVQHASDLDGIDLVLSTTELLASLDLGSFGHPVAAFDELLGEGTPEREWAEPDPRAVAAVVFTSGTTSRPKGVAHSVNTLRSAGRNMAEAFQLTTADAAFLSSPLASITGLVQMHLTLERGAGLILEDRFSPAGSLGRIRDHDATLLGGAPVIVEELFKEAARQDLTSLPLRAIALGGAMIPREVLELAVDRFGIAPTRMYGASEVPVATGTLPSDHGEVRIADDGAAARGVELGDDGPVPGELLVRGPMRCLGYLDAEDNSANFSEGGWYRTGDLGRIDAGRLTITRRVKEIVSRKGLKISLPEIDEAARALPGIEEVGAYPMPDPETGERLALAIYTLAPETVEFATVIRQLLDGGLAKWKLPEEIAVWERPLPRTETGKLQRRLLAAEEAPRRVLLAPRLQP